MPVKHTSYQMPFRVYYEDTDAGGIVYYANYLKFAERARTELLRSLGFSQQQLREQLGIGFVVRHIACDFTSPAKLDDVLMVDSRVEALQRTNMRMVQVILRDKQPLVSLQVQLACVNEAGRPTRIPEDIDAAMRKILSPPTGVPALASATQKAEQDKPVRRKVIAVPPKSKQH